MNTITTHRPVLSLRQRGFTLLELLIAISIFALISAMAYSALNHVLRSNEHLVAERAAWRELTMLWLRMEEDMAQARPRAIRNNIGLWIPALDGRPTDTRALGAPALELTRGGVFLPSPDEDDPTSLSPPVGLRQPVRSDLQRVGYRLNEGELWRLTWPDLDRGPQSTPRETSLLKDVEDFQVRYFAPKGGWVNVWPMTTAGGALQSLTDLPLGVEVRVVLKGRGEFKRLFLIHG